MVRQQYNRFKRLSDQNEFRNDNDEGEEEQTNNRETRDVKIR
jgi:hypothetical protein